MQAKTMQERKLVQELEEVSAKLDMAIEAGERGDWPKAQPCLAEIKRVVSRVLTAVEHINDIDKLTGRQICTTSYEAVLRQAHNGLSAMSQVCAAIRDNDLGAAERALTKAQDIATQLMKEVGDKARASLQVPSPDQGDRE